LDASKLSRARIAQKLNVSEESVRSWEKKTPPPFSKALALARLLQIPFGFFFLPQPPVQELPIPDFRRLDRSYRPTPEFLQLLNDILVKQDWYREYVKQSIRTTKLKFVGSFEVTSAVSDIAADIRNVIGLTPELRSSVSGWAEYLSTLARHAEEAGILVMRSSVVANSTARPVSTREVQGFAIADPIAPLAFVNSGDFKAAQVFTFAHELAHIWIGQSAISNPDPAALETNRIERFCNRVAAALLVPKTEFSAVWDDTPPESRLRVLSRRFWVSTLVVLRRAHELERISDEQFEALKKQEQENIQTTKAPSGGDFYRNLVVRMSPRFTYSVVSELNRDRLPLRDGARLLGVSPKTLAKFAEMNR